MRQGLMQKVGHEVIKDCVVIHVQKEAKLRLARNSQIRCLHFAVLCVCENMEQRFLGF